MANVVQGIHALAGAVLLALASPALAQDLAVVGARVYPAPDVAPIDDATVWIRDGRAPVDDPDTNDDYRYAHFTAPDGGLYELVQRLG